MTCGEDLARRQDPHESSHTLLPMPVMPRRVQIRRYHYSVLSLQNLVNAAIRKPIWVTPADVLRRVSPAIQQGILAEGAPNPDDLFYKFAAKPWLLRIIPGGGLGHVLFNLRAKFNDPVHLVNRERSRFSIVSSGTADLGSRRCSAMRFSTTASSSAASPGSSNSSARRTSNCRCGTVNDGNSASSSLKRKFLILGIGISFARCSFATLWP
jgi:hypothetical protein